MTGFTARNTLRPQTPFTADASNAALYGGMTLNSTWYSYTQKRKRVKTDE